jgi:hypothetical protein
MTGQFGKIRRWGLTLVLVCLSSCGGGEDDAVRRMDAALEATPVLKQYLAAQDALAGDRLDEALAALGHLSGSAPEQVQRLVAGAEGADSVRVLFRSISESLIDGKPLMDGLRVASCPMAFDYQGARWIQRDGDLANPYFGARMLHCGVFVEASMRE